MSEVKRYEMKTTYCGHESWDSLEEDKDGSYVSYEDYAELEAKCEALAAENARMKDYLSPIGLKVEWTTTTDDFMDEVRAQGVDMAACALDNVNQFNYANMLDDLAQKIRKGVQS